MNNSKEDKEMWKNKKGTDKRQSTGRVRITTVGIVFITVMLGYVCIQAFSGLYPFGETTNLLWDQDIQYVDYFAYFRDVLLGKASIGYSFSKSLGGSLVALFGYYLACPLNLLVVFFSREQIPFFLFLLTMVKLGLAGGSASVFFRKRFTQLSENAVIALSLGYGLMQYSMLQMSNIMWLDGVILLPLLLLGVYRLVQDGKRGMLYWMVLVSVAVNWYTGYMTCLFAGVYFLYEQALAWKTHGKEENRKVYKNCVIAMITVILGVLGSCFVFYPVFRGLQNGKDVFDPGIFYPQFYDALWDGLRGFSLGSVFVTVSFYCGLLLLGFMGYYFVSKEIEKREKIISGIAVAFAFISCWFVPLDCIWSGLRFVGSYRFRYSFVFIFLLLIIAARGMIAYQNAKQKLALVYVGMAGLMAVLYLLMAYETKKFILTMVFLLMYGAVFLFAKESGMGKKLRNACLYILLVSELIINGIFTFEWNYSESETAQKYSDYVVEEEKLVQEVKNYDDSVFYRMDTTTKRDQNPGRRSALLNEAMVYGYSGIAHYSSTYDKNISDVLNYAGYSTQLDLSIFGESILPMDALFGLKYLLSDREEAGYEKVEGLQSYNGKQVYYNPYALGLGFGASDSALDYADGDNAFLYQNSLFSHLLGRDVELYEIIGAESVLENGQIQLDVPAAEGESLVYATMTSYPEAAAWNLSIDGEYRCEYEDWLSYKTFYIGEGSLEHQVVFESYGAEAESYHIDVYRLNMDVFKDVIDELREREIQVQAWEDGYVKGSYKAQEDGWVVLSIPCDVNWKVLVNGEEVAEQESAGAMMAVPVNEGENSIEMHYQIPGMKKGILLTGVSLVLWLLWYLGEQKNTIRRCKKRQIAVE